MKNSFPGYYQPTEQEFRELWDNCLFVVDANVLLDIYRYSQKTREEMLRILKKLEDRLWIPYQVGLEYQRNLPEVIEDQFGACDRIAKALEDLSKSVDKALKPYYKHPYLPTQGWKEKLDEAIGQVRSELNEIKKSHRSLFLPEKLQTEIDSLFNGRIGEPYGPDEYRKACDEGRRRYELRIPPGYSDRGEKDGDRQYGDYVFWGQILIHAKHVEKPVVLITNEKKEDWWWKIRGKTRCPKPELIEEFLHETGPRFYMYRMNQFVERARSYLHVTVDDLVITEVRDVADRRIALKQAIARLREAEEERRGQREAMPLLYLLDYLGEVSRPPDDIKPRFIEAFTRKWREPSAEAKAVIQDFLFKAMCDETFITNAALESSCRLSPEAEGDMSAQTDINPTTNEGQENESAEEEGGGTEEQ